MKPQEELSTQTGNTASAPALQPANRGLQSFLSTLFRPWLVACLLIMAAAIRIYAALNDLWLDEIWSLRWVQTISSPLEVFTKIHHDNNHYLNSLWFYWVGFRGNWPGYRIPSIVAGVGSVMLAGLIGRRRNAQAAFFAMFLLAFSYVQILYSSEARGYSAVVFFSFLSSYALDQYMEKPRWQPALIFSLSSILGFLAHLIFLNFFCAAMLWSGWRFIKSGRGTSHTVKSMLACHAAPTTFLIALYFVDIRRLRFGGGTATSFLPGAYAHSLAWALGAPPGRIIMLSTAFLAAALFIAAIRILWREKSDSLIFFTGVVLVFPVLFNLIHHSYAIYVRYFIIGMAFFLILLSFLLAALYQRGLQGRLLCALLLAGYFAVNAWHTISLFKHGRGHYGEAVRFLIQNTKGPEVTVASDEDFQISLVLKFHVDAATGDKTVQYYNDWPQGIPEWVILHNNSTEAPIPSQAHITNATGNNSYAFVKAFQTAPLSGAHWFVYHKQTK